MDVYIIYNENPIHYAGYLIYTNTMAAYTFYRVVFAAVKFAKKPEGASPLTKADKTISFSSALVSLFFLQNAMFSSFGGSEDSALSFTMNMVTGACIFAALSFYAIYMIIHAGKRLNKK
ncbi:MAG: hypothetical protein ACI4QR_02365 [Eubacteriales bacterium]